MVSISSKIRPCVLVCPVSNVTQQSLKSIWVFGVYFLWTHLDLASLLDSTAVSIFIVILVESTNTVFVNSTNLTTNTEMAALSNIAG